MLILLFAQFYCALPFLLKIKMYKISRIARVFTSKRIINQGLLLFLAAFQRATAFQGIVQRAVKIIIVKIAGLKGLIACTPVTVSAEVISTNKKLDANIDARVRIFFITLFVRVLEPPGLHYSFLRLFPSLQRATRRRYNLGACFDTLSNRRVPKHRDLK